MTNDDKKKTKVFISYCWDNPEIVERVHAFADFLDANNIHLEMDRYLPDGANLHRFMEQMVTNPEISRVLCFLDLAYMQKAAEGEGGVGTETTIITPDVYKQAAKGDQNRPKFVPVLLEKPVAGQPGIPTMFGTAKYSYMVDPAKDESHKLRLLDICEGRPEYRRTENAVTPPHLRELPVVFDQAATGIATLIHTYLHQDKARLALISFEDYLTTVANVIEGWKNNDTPENYFHDRTGTLEQLFTAQLPLLGEYFRLLEAVLKYTDSSIEEPLFEFFRRLMVFNFGSADRSTRDLSRLLTRELFTLTVTAFMRRRRYSDIHHLLSRRYRTGSLMRTYMYHSYGPEDLWKDEKWQQHLTLAAWQYVGVPESEMLQAEVIMIVWGEVQRMDEGGWSWSTLDHLRYTQPPFFWHIDDARTAATLADLFGLPVKTVIDRLLEFQVKYERQIRGSWKYYLNFDGLERAKAELQSQ